MTGDFKNIVELLEDAMDEIRGNVETELYQSMDYREEIEVKENIIHSHSSLKELMDGQATSCAKEDAEAFLKWVECSDRINEMKSKEMYYQGICDAFLLMVRVNLLK